MCFCVRNFLWRFIICRFITLPYFTIVSFNRCIICFFDQHETIEGFELIFFFLFIKCKKPMESIRRLNIFFSFFFSMFARFIYRQVRISATYTKITEQEIWMELIRFKVSTWALCTTSHCTEPLLCEIFNVILYMFRCSHIDMVSPIWTLLPSSLLKFSTIQWVPYELLRSIDYWFYFRIGAMKSKCYFEVDNFITMVCPPIMHTVHSTGFLADEETI